VVKDAKPRVQVDAKDRKQEVRLMLPQGSYRAEWINPKTGRVDASERFQHTGGERVLQSPTYTEDIALRIRK
jgi:hypothetical protein